jgi:hypothetical protein
MEYRMTHQIYGRIGKKRYPLVLQMIAEGRPGPEIARTLAVDPETVRKWAMRRGIKLADGTRRMENHPMWNGGTVRDRTGYLLRRVAADGPHGYLIRARPKRGIHGLDQCGYAPEHRIVMHDKIGRRLMAGEVVDHIDGDNQNNHPDNLRVFPSNKAHLIETLKGKCPNWTPEGKAKMTGRPKNPRPASLSP